MSAGVIADTAQQIVIPEVWWRSRMKLAHAISSSTSPAVATLPPDEAAEPGAPERMLRALRIDGPATFQTFGDQRGVKRRGLAGHSHGTLAGLGPMLLRQNEQGAGIFIMVNEGDGHGRKAKNVVRVRALFLDLDGAPLDPVLQAGQRPHLVVETSPGRYHVYWLVHDCPLDAFTPAQKALSRRFDGDTKVCDLPRVMRIPGFMHNKANPFLVHIKAEWDGPAYAFRELLAALDCESGAPALPHPAHREPATQLAHLQKSTEDISSVLFCASSVGLASWGLACSSVGEAIDSTLPTEPGQRNGMLFDLARRVVAMRPDATDAMKRELAVEWHRRALPNIGTRDPRITISDFLHAWDAVQIPHGAVMNKIIERASGMTPQIPPGLVVSAYGEHAKALLRLCWQLHLHQQAEHAGDPFFLGARAAGKAIDLDFTSAAKLLKAFVDDGVLSLESVGAGRRASRYRWTGPTLPD